MLCIGDIKMNDNKVVVLVNTPSSALRASSPSRGKGTIQAFTLIELLVVVLIIGILAAVALPQYQKAVMKSRFTEWAAYINSFDKALAVWELANELPESTTMYFTGNGAGAGQLDIDLPCENKNDNYCYTKIGRFVMGGSIKGSYIDFGTNYSGYNGPFAQGQSIWTSKYYNGTYNGKRVLIKVPTNKTFRKIVCQWWVTHHGKEQMHEDAITSCAEVGI